ncbi:P-loop containing nucleoside triphosphate hydrolase protein [Vararia minispora EC-137]|uniref:P-loop containing nucleoside triphosphate hydrolase protein n=1 Tax=Vararia minispora EC-137 TaxID=1314806 RepID=A0ACB8QFD2_9AGAM|nr:P-loop containing nucleoside triphosphate hydrolase protein [Vararia minispora EC-137]
MHSITFHTCRRLLLPSIRTLHATGSSLHENPLGLPRNTDTKPPQFPRRGTGPPIKRAIPNVKRVVLVASGKGGVGKSSVAVNLATILAMREGRERLRVGLLDLDVFGPSVPKLMGLDRADEPLVTQSGALVPLLNHGLPCMSMGFLLGHDGEDKPVVWRGLMVQKAVQQLLFDVDWRADASGWKGTGLDVLVVDMPPGTGDVPLTVGQLVKIDGVVIVSTPQDVALADVRKGIAMFRKVGVPISGLILNQAYMLCPNCDSKHELFGSAHGFKSVASNLGVKIMAELPLVPQVSASGDSGNPYALVGAATQTQGGLQWMEEMERAAALVLDTIQL